MSVWPLSGPLKVGYLVHVGHLCRTSCTDGTVLTNGNVLSNNLLVVRLHKDKHAVLWRMAKKFKILLWTNHSETFHLTQSFLEACLNQPRTWVSFLRPPVKGWWANYWDDNLDMDGSPLTSADWWHRGKIWPQLWGYILLLTAVVGRHAGREGIGQFWAVYRANSSSGQMPVGLEKAEFGRLPCRRSHQGERWPSPGSLSCVALVNATPDLSIFICNKVSGSF